jgi:hypothetical protein
MFEKNQDSLIFFPEWYVYSKRMKGKLVKAIIRRETNFLSFRKNLQTQN